MLAAFRHCLSKYLLIWLVLTCLLAFFWDKIFGPNMFDPFIISKDKFINNIFSQSLIAVTMLAIGSLLPLEEVKMVGRRWPTVLLGTAVQYISMPALAFLFASLFQLKGSLFIGAIIVGSVPGAMASNMLTMIARGNVSYSVSLTTSATLLSPIIVPFTLYFLIGTQGIQMDVGAVIITLLLTVLLPVIIGFSLAQSFSWWRNMARQIAEIAANGAIIWIIASVVAKNRTLFLNLPDNFLILLIALICINICGYAAGYFGGGLFGLETKSRRALLLEVGMQNAGLGTVLAGKFFPDMPEAAFCCALYTFGCMFSGILVAQLFHIYDDRKAQRSV